MLLLVGWLSTHLGLDGIPALKSVHEGEETVASSVLNNLLSSLKAYNILASAGLFSRYLILRVLDPAKLLLILTKVGVVALTSSVRHIFLYPAKNRFVFPSCKTNGVTQAPVSLTPPVPLLAIVFPVVLSYTLYILPLT